MTTPPGYPDPGSNPPPYPGTYQPPAQPGYPAGQYSVPPAGYGYGYPAPYGPPPSGTNGLAVGALVAAFFAPMAGLVMGIIALNQVKKNGQSGRGMALAAVIISSLWFVLIILIFVVAIIASMNSPY